MNSTTTTVASVATWLALALPACSDVRYTASCTPTEARAAGARVVAETDGDSEDGKRLVTAARDGDLITVQTLLESGVPPDAATGDVTVDERDGFVVVVQGGTPLALAAVGGHGAVVDALLCAGARIDAPAESGETALHFAVAAEDIATAALLLEFGAPPDPSMPQFSGLTSSPLHTAVGYGDIRMVELLLDYRANPDSMLAMGVTPLHVAISERHMDIADLLMKRGASPDPQVEFTLSALHLAVRRNLPRMVDQLLDAGADPNVQDGEGNTPLTHAVADGYESIAEELLEHGADPNVQNSFRETALGWAVARENESLAKILLEAGANPLLEDQYGRSIIGSARSDEIRRLMSTYADRFSTGGPTGSSAGIEVPAVAVDAAVGIEENISAEELARAAMATPEWDEVQALQERIRQLRESGESADDSELPELVRRQLEATARAFEVARQRVQETAP